MTEPRHRRVAGLFSFSAAGYAGGMSLISCIDAQFAVAEARGTKPFRLELQEAEIQKLAEAGVLEPKPTELDSSSGMYRDVKVYPATKRSELLAQPSDALPALYLALD